MCEEGKGCAAKDPSKQLSCVTHFASSGRSFVPRKAAHISSLPYVSEILSSIALWKVRRRIRDPSFPAGQRAATTQDYGNFFLVRVWYYASENAVKDR